MANNLFYFKLRVTFDEQKSKRRICFLGQRYFLYSLSCFIVFTFLRHIETVIGSVQTKIHINRILYQVCKFRVPSDSMALRLTVSPWWQWISYLSLELLSPTCIEEALEMILSYESGRIQVMRTLSGLSILFFNYLNGCYQLIVTLEKLIWLSVTNDKVLIKAR